LSIKTIQYKNSITVKKITLDSNVVNIDRDGSTLSVIPLVYKNVLYDIKMDNLFCSLLAIPTIQTIKVVNPLAPYFHG
jgi:hypothetical protein